MARYTPEFLAALRHRYEKTDQPMRSIAAEAGIGLSTLQALVQKERWTKRSERTRVLPGAMNLLEQARALATGHESGGMTVQAPPPLSATAEAPPAPTTAPAPTDGTAAPSETAAPNLSAIDRLEALVVKEIAAEELAREELQLQPRARGDAERCARTLATLTQTLQTLRRMRSGEPSAPHVCQCCDYDDIPEDLDAFRDELARRIREIVKSREGEQPGADTGEAAMEEREP